MPTLYTLPVKMRKGARCLPPFPSGEVYHDDPPRTASVVIRAWDRVEADLAKFIATSGAAQLRSQADTRQGTGSTFQCYLAYRLRPFVGVTDKRLWRGRDVLLHS